MLHLRLQAGPLHDVVANSHREVAALLAAVIKGRGTLQVVRHLVVAVRRVGAELLLGVDGAEERARHEARPDIRTSDGGQSALDPAGRDANSAGGLAREVLRLRGLGFKLDLGVLEASVGATSKDLAEVGKVRL